MNANKRRKEISRRFFLLQRCRALLSQAIATVTKYFSKFPLPKSSRIESRVRTENTAEYLRTTKRNANCRVLLLLFSFLFIIAGSCK